MRLDDAGPRTRLLATATGWAILAWILALAGMGSHVETLPEDPSLLRPLPPMRPAPPPRLGPLAQYADIAQRPLFSQDRRPKPFLLNRNDPAEGAATSFDYQLTSVLISPQASIAILQPTAGGEPVRVRLNEAPEPSPGWRLVQLNPRSAVFDGPEGQRTLELRVFNGQGGEAPTASSTGGPAANRPPVAAPGTSVPIAPPPAPATQARVAKPSSQSGGTPAGTSEASEASTPSEQDQMEAIRRRIEARREQMRQQQQQQQSPPVK